MIYNTKELMQILKVKESMCYKILNSGEIKAFKMGSSWKIPKKSVEDYINKKIGGLSNHERQSDSGLERL